MSPIVPFLRPVRVLLRFAASWYFWWISLVFRVANCFVTRRNIAAPTDELLLISATEAAERIRSREITSLALVEAYIKRIESVNPTINAIAERNFDDARRRARDVDAMLDTIEPHGAEMAKLIATKPLLGVPFTLKDSVEVAGMHCTVGIFYRKETIAEEDAVVVHRMKAAGAIVLALTVVPEVCMWWETVNVLHGRSRNPYDSRRITGGSSGGEGAILAAAGSVIGIGADIGGSIRIPSFCNGIFGLKPTPGIVPLDGYVPVAEGYRAQMLRVGPMCRYATDLGIMLKVLGGSNADLQLQLDTPVDLRQLRIFYMEGLNTGFVQDLSHDMRKTLKKAVSYFERKYDLVAIRLDLPLAHYAMEFFMTSMDVEGVPTFSQHMTDLKSDINIPLEFIRFFARQSKHTMPALITAIADKFPAFDEDQKNFLRSQRDRLKRELRELLGDDGILLFPSFPTVAPFHCLPIFTPMNFCYTALFNSIAVPVVQCPMGLDASGMPLGVQAVATPGLDRLLIAVAKDLEQGFGGWRPANNH